MTRQQQVAIGAIVGFAAAVFFLSVCELKPSPPAPAEVVKAAAPAPPPPASLLPAGSKPSRLEGKVQPELRMPLRPMRSPLIQLLAQDAGV